MLLTKSEKVFQVINYIVLTLISFMMLIPVWHVFMFSLSNPNSVFGGGLFFLPRDFSFAAYRVVLRDPLIGGAYLNTIFVVIAGTIVNLLFSFLISYPLNKKDLKGRSVIQYLIFFTMLFSGGMIPKFLVVKSVGLLDSLWALIIPGAVSTYNVFVLRNFISTIPESLSESARIDGAGEFYILWRIIVPLSKPALAVLGLMYGVGHWNSWFDCIIYINTTAKYTLQPILRQILFAMGSLQFFAYDPDLAAGAMPEVVKMAVIMVATVPILCVYPFLQKYFIKGIMLGSVKG
jgi:putative aldouronate transport system permease protein